MGDVAFWVFVALGTLAVTGFGLLGLHILLVERVRRRMRHRRRQ